MNKLIIPNGGMPLHGDDFAFMQSATSEAIKGALHLFALPYQGNLILSGCEVVSGVIAPGFVMLDYEVLYFAGGPLPSSFNDGPKFVLAITYDTVGNDVFADSVARDTYQVRRAVIVDQYGGLEVNGPRLEASLRAIIDAQYTDGLVSSFANSWTATGQVRVRKLAGGMKHLYGVFGVGTISETSYTKVCTLPSAEYRPVGADRYLLVPILGVGFKTALLKIRTNGDVEILAPVADPSYAMVRVEVSYL